MTGAVSAVDVDAVVIAARVARAATVAALVVAFGRRQSRWWSPPPSLIETHSAEEPRVCLEQGQWQRRRRTGATKTQAKHTTKRLRVTYVKSAIGYNVKQKQTIEALGLRRLQQVITHPDTPAVRGMLNKVSHLVRVEEVEEAAR